jgi:hypothetical protein
MFILSIVALFACAPAPTDCDLFVDAWNTCVSAGFIDRSACEGEEYGGEVACALDAVRAADCSTVEGRTAMTSAVTACSGTHDTGNDTGYNDTGSW